MVALRNCTFEVGNFYLFFRALFFLLTRGATIEVAIKCKSIQTFKVFKGFGCATGIDSEEGKKRLKSNVLT